MKKKLTKIDIEMLTVLGWLFVVLVLHFINQELLMQIGLMCVVLVCEYKFFEKMIWEDGIKRLACVEYWVYMAGIVSLLEFSLTGRKDKTSIILVLITIAIVGVRSGIYYFANGNVVEKIRTYLVWILIVLVVMLAMSIKNGTLFLLSRILFMFVLCSGIKLTRYVSPAIGIVIVVGIYVMMVIASGVFTTDFLYAPMEEGWQHFYEGVKNMYAWPEKLANYDKINVMEVLVSFVTGRIMDAILIGVLVERINKMID